MLSPTIISHAYAHQYTTTDKSGAIFLPPNVSFELMFPPSSISICYETTLSVPTGITCLHDYKSYHLLKIVPHW